MTVTFDLPETLARQLLAMPEPERNQFALARLADEDEEEIGAIAPLSLEDLAALRQSRADLDAGRVMPMRTVLADFRKKHGLLPRPLPGES